MTGGDVSPALPVSPPPASVGGRASCRARSGATSSRERASEPPGPPSAVEPPVPPSSGGGPGGPASSGDGAGGGCTGEFRQPVATATTTKATPSDAQIDVRSSP